LLVLFDDAVLQSQNLALPFLEFLEGILDMGESALDALEDFWR